MAQEEEKLFQFNWGWTSIIPIAVGIVEAAVWLLIEHSPKWARFDSVAYSLSTIILGLLSIGAYNATVKWTGLNLVRWGVGLLFIGVAVSRLVWPAKVSEIPPPTVAFSKDVCPYNLRTTVTETGQMPPDILRMRLKVSNRAECKDEVRLALVARLEDNTTDRMTDYRIEKSGLFSPVSEQMELRMHVTETFLRRAAPERSVMLTLLALPARLTPSDWSKVTTINQAVRSGGLVIDILAFPLLCKCPGKKACSTASVVLFGKDKKVLWSAP